LIAGGLLVQLVTGSLLPGGLLLVLGNVPLLVRGYDNRVDYGTFDPDAHWERVGLEKLRELRGLHERIKRWDRSALDISNGLGLVVFIAVVGGLVVTAIGMSAGWRILALDALILLAPHWLTGIRSILVKPKLLVRIDTMEEILETAKPLLERHQVTLMMLLRGNDTRIPEDVKFKVDITSHHPDFLGLYGQVVINEVQGTSYPYFYVVLVARRGFGLEEAHHSYRPQPGTVKEIKRQEKVEVLVLRQQTTKTSGYHTEPEVASRILRQGLRLAERLATVSV
jgi:hypothetical protein